MSTDYKTLLKETRAMMDKAVNHALHEFSNIHTGKASPSMVENIQVYIEAYGTKMAIRDLGAVSTPDSRTISITPWDRNVIKPIEKAILTADLGFNPRVAGTTIHVPVPELSGDRRKELAKIASSYAEEARVGVRHARHFAMEGLKKMKAAGASEDEIARHEKEIQTETDRNIEAINAALKAKEEELLKI